jgi:hypothetical protein
VVCGIGESGLLCDLLGSSSEDLVLNGRESEGTDRIVPFAPFVVRMAFEYSVDVGLLPCKEFILLIEREARVRIGTSL